MSQLTTLDLDADFQSKDLDPEPYASAPPSGAQLRYAFLALLALNLFVVSGAACFAFLYFAH